MATENKGLGARLAWTLVLALLPLAAKQVPLPGVARAALPPEYVANASIGALGVSPLLSAFITVELVAYVVPRWRRLRHGFPDGRARLERAVAVLALVLAAFQGVAVGLLLDSPVLGIEVQPALVAGTLVLVTAGLLAAARRIDQQGLVSGVLLMALVGHSSDFAVFVAGAGLPSDAAARVAAALALSLPVAATWIAFRSPAEQPTSGTIQLSVPASSLHPVAATVALLEFPRVLAGLDAPGAPLLERLATAISGPQRLGITTSVTLLAALVLIWLLQPARVVQYRLRALEAEPELLSLSAVRRARRQVVVPSLAFVFVLLAAYQVSEAVGLWGGVAVHLALLTALVLDGARAWRGLASTPDLVCVWEERRPYAVGPLLAAASRADIALLASGAATTGLLRAFAPFVAVRLWCRAADADAAREVLGPLLVDANAPVVYEPDEDRDEAGAPTTAAAPPASQRWSLGAGSLAGVLVLVAAGLWLWLSLSGPR